MVSDDTNAPEQLDSIHTATHDWKSDDSVAVTVARALADCEQVPPYDISPLYESVDTDALNALFCASDRTDTDRTAFVQFPASESAYLVTVHADGRIGIAERPDSLSA